MQSLLSRFKVALKEQGVQTADGYRSGKLKRKLQNYFGDSLVFHQQIDPSRHELIYSSHISLKCFVNAASKASTISMPNVGGPSQQM